MMKIEDYFQRNIILEMDVSMSDGLISHEYVSMSPYTYFNPLSPAFS